MWSEPDNAPARMPVSVGLKREGEAISLRTIAGTLSGGGEFTDPRQVPVDLGYCIIRVEPGTKDRRNDYVLEHVNEVFERQTGLRGVCGKSMREIAPGHEQYWYDTFERVSTSGNPERFEAAAGELGRWIDVFAFPVGERGSRRVGVLFQDITLRREAELAQARLAAIVETSDDAIISKDLTGVITSWNRGAQRVFGFSSEEMVGRSVLTLFPPDRVKEETDILARLSRGERIEHYETVRRHKDGTLIDISLTISPLKDVMGRIVGASKIARDISERKRREAQMQMIMAELNHRVKNTLAVIQSLARQTIRRSADLHTFQQSFEHRLQAIAKAHGLLTRSEWTGASLRDVLSAELVTYAMAEGNVHVEGPEVMLRPSDVLALHMVFHELATNARKYGGLKTLGGQVSIRWSLDPALEWITLDWVERTVTSVSAPTQHGYGSELIKQLIEYQLGGTVEIEYRPEGMSARLTFCATGAEKPAAQRARSPSQLLGKNRSSVLVVEDTATLAMELASLLGESGLRVVGPASTMDQARALIASEPIGIAILDINLNGEDSYPLIRELRSRGVPCMLLTGYEKMSLPEDLRDLPLLEKPVRLKDLEAHLRGLR